MLGIFGKKKAKSGLVGVSYSNQELALAYIEYRGGEPRLLLCESQKADSLASATRQLAELVRKYGLERARCNFVLGTEDYSLLLLEAPAVEKAELASAAKWKIKDMVDRPLEQLAVSVFQVPKDAYRSQRDMLYVVAADRKKVQQAVDMVLESGLQLQTIDIPELAMLNLLQLEKHENGGIALIDLRYNGSLLSLCRNDEIYLTRHLNTQVGEDIVHSNDWEGIRERLVLELQRSLDYYESQMGQSHIGRVLLAPRKTDSEALVNQLNAAMGVKVEVLNLAPLSEDLELPAGLQQSCMMAIGGALRLEEAA